MVTNYYSALPVPYFTKYHVREQSARALLQPIAASLGELARRTKHYVERLSLDPGADQALTAANEAIATARAEIERLMNAAPPAGAAE
ncbi:MAG: hypothetical protein ACR2NO_05055 [Chloroflexota bacterium]